jgi:hypothetical protein
LSLKKKPGPKEALTGRRKERERAVVARWRVKVVRRRWSCGWGIVEKGKERGERRDGVGGERH